MSGIKVEQSNKRVKGVRVQEEESEASGELQTPIKSLYYLILAGHTPSALLYELCSTSSALCSLCDSGGRGRTQAVKVS